MVLKYSDKNISSLDDIQKLTAKDLREILRSHGESAGETKADLVLKVFALLMRSVIPSANNGENEAAIPAEEQNDSSFKYEATLRSLSALGWSSYLRQLSEMNFVQLYDYLVVSTRKYQHIVLKGTHYKKLKSYQFFLEGNVKKLECKHFEDKTYVKANVLPSMKRTPYKVVFEFSPTQGINVKVEDVGLLMSKEKPFLAASLDRIITNLTSNEKWGMEIKSPFSKAGMTVEDACKAKNFFFGKT